jgi:hypothetical protein
VKKTIKRPDGSEEVVEGTAEEIAEYEQKLREVVRSVKGKKKPVLHGAEVDGKPLTDSEVMMVRLSRMGILPQKEDRPVYIPQIVPYTLGPVTCWVCGQLDCRINHIICNEPVTWTDTKITMSPPRESDRLGTFLYKYEQYLDGNLDYSDLPLTTS